MAGFGDIRVSDRADWFLDRIVATGSLVLKRLGEDRAGEIAVQRLLASRHASVAAVIDTVSARTAAACAGRDIVCAQDTSEINFSGRYAARHGLGPAGDGQSPGFFLHPLVAIDAGTGAVLGLAGAGLWTRSSEPTPDRHTQPPDAKESRRWLAGAERAAAVLDKALSTTVVGDRESDIYHLFANRPPEVELIVRATHNRALDDGGALFDAVATQIVTDQTPVETCIVLIVPRKPGEKARQAQVALRSCRVRLARPVRLGSADAPDSVAPTVPMTIVEAREIDPPKGVKPLLWRLLSSADRPPADIVRLYRLRWRIEEVFRSLKSGLGLPETQIHGANRIFLLAAFALTAAVRIIQLVDARDGSDRPISDAIDPAFTPALIAISRSLERQTQRQKNPHPTESLAFLAWIAARLGGWNCYGKPPGPKTMATGWNALAQQLKGYKLATETINA